MLLENMNERWNSFDTDGTFSHPIVSVNFPKRGESSSKRKRRSNDKLYHDKAKTKTGQTTIETKMRLLKEESSSENYVRIPSNSQNKSNEDDESCWN